MPNWTSNKMIITGKKKNLDRLFAEAVLMPMDDRMTYTFESWFPVPQTFHDYDTTNHPYGERLEIGRTLRTGSDSDVNDGKVITQEIIDAYKKASEEQKAKYGVVGWYDYNCRYFGCKWVCDFELERKGAEYAETNIFDTPWSAPLQFVSRLANKYKVNIEIYSHYEDNYNAGHSFFYDEDEDCIGDSEIDGSEIGEEIRKTILENLDHFEDKERAKKLLDTYIDGDWWNICYNYDIAEALDILEEYVGFLDYYEDDEEEDTEGEATE